MRELSPQCETVRISSVTGELRDISVSGLAKVRLHWLFRNFRILDFSVLDTKQKKLIAQAWYTGQDAGEVDPLFDVVGTVEGFTPQLFQPPASVKLHQPFPPKPPASQRVSVDLTNALRTAAWIAVGVVLVGCATFLRSGYRSTPPTPVVTVAASNPISSPSPIVPAVVAEAAPPAAEPPAAEPLVSNASSVSPPHLPDAMAFDTSSQQVKPSLPPAAQIAKPREKPEVIIRVSVDGEGRAQSFHIVQGEQKKVSAALNAAKLLHFPPCELSAQCEHSVKFTDYGDASVVQIID
jgi:hypothetical protein